jgi:hypothetical protein
MKRKTTLGQPNSGTPLSEDKVSYKALVIIYPRSSHTFNNTYLYVNASQPSLPLEGVFYGFRYLRAPP